MPEPRPVALLASAARTAFRAGRGAIHLAGSAISAVRQRALGSDEDEAPPLAPVRPLDPDAAGPSSAVPEPKPKVPKAASTPKPKAPKVATTPKPKAPKVAATAKPKASKAASKPKRKAAKAEPEPKSTGQPRRAPAGTAATGFPEPPGKDPGDISKDPSPHHALNNPVVDDPDLTEWPDPYERREDPRDPPDPDGEPFGEQPRPAAGSTSTSEPHPSQDPEAGDRWEGPKRDKLDQ